MMGSILFESRPNTAAAERRHRVLPVGTVASLIFKENTVKLKRALYRRHSARKAGAAPELNRLAPEPAQRLPLRLAAGLAVCTAGLTLQLHAASAAPLPWMNTALSPEARAALLVGAMTIAEKEEQLVGSIPGTLPELPQCKGGRHVTGIPSLEIPTLRITNGPVGIGQNDCVSTSVPPIFAQIGGDLVDVSVYSSPTSAKATALPSAIAVASS